MKRGGDCIDRPFRTGQGSIYRVDGKYAVG